MPQGSDPDDFIKKEGVKGLQKLLNGKQIIQKFIWDHHLSKINENNPHQRNEIDYKLVNEYL